MNGKHAHRILLIDDQAAIHEDYRKILGTPTSTSSAAVGKAAAELFGDDAENVVDWEGFELDSAFQGQEGLELVQRSIAQRHPYSMAFVDIRMPPGWDGVETVQRIWEVDPEILIVICSAYSDYSWDEMVRELGRNDRYLILKKPFDNIEVRQCAMALTERWHLSRTDVLTGLLNRRAFRSYLDVEWRRSDRHKFPLAYAMIDLDDFKRVNDTLGHHAGDVALKNVAQMLQDKSRASDFVCRYGGDEICVLLPHTDEHDAARWAENVQRALASTSMVIANRPVTLTASFGVADRLATDDSAEEMMERADRALIRAKILGRNRVVAFSATNQAGAAHDAPPQHDNVWNNVALRDVMTAPILSLKAGSTIAEAVQFLLRFHADSAPVVGSDGKLIGIFSEDDVVGVLPGQEAWSVPVERIMHRTVACRTEDTPVQSICELLTCTAVLRVVIVRDDRPIGIVSRRSLLRCQYNQFNSPADNKVRDALQASGDINRDRLMQNVQAVAQCATRISRDVSQEPDASLLAILENVSSLRDSLDNVLSGSESNATPTVLGNLGDEQPFGATSGPMAPLG